VCSDSDAIHQQAGSVGSECRRIAGLRRRASGKAAGCASGTRNHALSLREVQQSQFAGIIRGSIPAFEWLGILICGGAAFCVSLALDLLRAEFPQAQAVRALLIVASFASFLVMHRDGAQLRPYSVIDFILHAEHDPVDFFLLAGVVIAIGTINACVADPRFISRLTKYPLLLALLPKGRLRPSANPLKFPSEVR
jgi:hypothetical protein